MERKIKTRFLKTQARNKIFWKGLTKEQYYTTHSKFLHLETLGNLRSLAYQSSVRNMLTCVSRGLGTTNSCVQICYGQYESNPDSALLYFLWLSFSLLFRQFHVPTVENILNNCFKNRKTTHDQNPSNCSLTKLHLRCPCRPGIIGPVSQSPFQLGLQFLPFYISLHHSV